MRYGGSTDLTLMWVLLGLLWIALIALIAFLVSRLVRTPGGGGAAGPDRTVGDEPPEATLDRMFALGEIDEPTYRARRTALAEMRGQP